MKKYLIVLLTLTSCFTVRVTIGMSESEFTQTYKAAEMVEMSNTRDVYSMVLYQNGHSVKKFFYFADHKLFRVDEGTPRPDITIQNNQ